MKQITSHIQHYLPLIGIFVAGIIGFSLFSYDRLFQSMIVVAVGVSYIIWGVIHHHIHRDLYLSVFVEYLAVAILGMTLIFTLLLRT